MGYMETVPDRTAATLLPIIQGHLEPGTNVHSDEWRAYRRVQQIPAVASHSTVNHSVNFMDPQTGTHTQNIESYWARVKYKFKQMKGVDGDQMESYLDEFMWQERFGKTAKDTLDICCLQLWLCGFRLLGNNNITTFHMIGVPVQWIELCQEVWDSLLITVDSTLVAK